MARACREYVTVHGLGTPLENQQTAWAITDALAPLTDANRVGVLAIGLATKEDIENESLDVERVLTLTEGRLPAMFVNVTFENDDLSAADFADWEARFELKLLGERVSAFL